MAFMEQEITQEQLWIAVEGTCGCDLIPCDLVEFHHALPLDEGITDAYPRLFAALCAAVQDYTEQYRIEAIVVRRGYGARLSAPGYMDCTEWDVFDSVAEAQAYLDEMVPDEEEESAEEDND
jgi:hypothetical protein